MGARVIFHCLLELSRDPINAGRGIVESAVLLGAPVGTHHSEWAAARSVVAGRLVNCYSTQDWFLALMYRCKSWDVGVAGLQPVHVHAVTAGDVPSDGRGQGEDSDTLDEGRGSPAPGRDAKIPSLSSKILQAVKSCSVEDVENINVTALVQSHVDYCESLMYILPAVFSRE